MYATGRFYHMAKQSKHASFFAVHDLTHYAVETVLGCRGRFFGLIAAGWSVEDTTRRGGCGTLPPEAVEVEKIVGLFQTEQASCTLWTAAEFNEFSPRALTETEIQNVRTLRATMFRKWFAVQPGEKLELEFESAWPRW